jgi:preprotein translocase subunit SecG
VLDALNALQGGTTSDLPVPASDPVAPAGTDPVTEDIAPTAPASETAPAAGAASDLPVPEAPAAPANN